jgi:drug/metabolite transporter (DMT)-like permease
LQSNTKAHIAVLFTNIFFAANYSLVKYISPSRVGPYGLNILRVGISLILFWLVWLTGKSKVGIRKEHLGRFILCGLTGIAINQMLFIKGLTLTSFWILKEKITIAKAAGIALGIGGAVLLILSKEKSGTASFAGDMLIVCNAISYTLYFMLVKPLMKEYPPIHVVRWVFTFGFIMILPFGWMQFSAIQWSSFEWSHFASLSSIIICGTFLAYLFTVYGLQHLGAGITGSYIYTQPVFTAIVAIIFLNESLTIEKMLAGIMIFTGVFLVSRKTPPVVQE